MIGDDRQVGHPPLLELGVVLVGVGKLDKMAHGPGDDVIGPLEVPVALAELAGQHADEVAPDGRLLGDDERLGHRVAG